MNKLYIGLIALVFAAALLIPGCKGHPAKPPVAAVRDAIYTCPMHPQVIAHQPGKCPICGMDLVKKEFTTAETGNETADLGTLLKPTNTFVFSSVPVTTIRTGKQAIDRDVLGRVDYDTRRIHTISARVSGRIEKLYVKYRFQHVHQGAKIMDIYSPELVTAQQDLLFLLRRDPDNPSLLNAAREKLLLLGMTRQQVEQVTRTGKASYTVSLYSDYSGHIHGAGAMNEVAVNTGQPMDVAKGTEELPVKEGMYVTKGQTIFQLFNTDNSWVLLNIFPDDVPLIKPGMPVTIFPETTRDSFDARIDFVEPVFRDNSKTLTARVYFDNSTRQIPIGSQVKAIVHHSSPQMKWLPRTSVLNLGLSHVVLKKIQGGFSVQAVQTGMLADGLIQVMGGLDGQDSVATDAQFLMDSESFIKVKQQ
ncbi:efflux RND transporter periplasmic adaptor subunit [Flavitalea sp. BT771]|uniref:efflux RND transporter periplasmic adaptor subunit n=1 Tax=Flavitalea sp. BT771 TaxID=3063329 RepID=UPI0026E46F3F|nr:efflux RND transporter periplasmic adaptor subunit [Flavitalea sp. BT771]MDO6429969.1 efflux RND transporter periplasmic adaptor subunit [Flavitalea sp. BT771]MDV6217903.1 efflux RND transporter periplasmic adaptor subunit [Flavitalea sp. BT771]